MTTFNNLNFVEMKKNNFVNKILELGIITQECSKKMPTYNHKINSKRKDIPKKTHLILYSKERDFKNLFFECSHEIGKDDSTYKAICLVPINIAKKFYSGELDESYSKYFSRVHFGSAKNFVNFFEELNKESYKTLDGYFIGIIAGDNKGNYYDIQIFPSETVKYDDSSIEFTAKRCLEEEFGLMNIEQIFKITQMNNDMSLVVFELL